MKSQVLHTVWCYISGEAAGEIWNWSLLGVKGLRQGVILQDVENALYFIHTEIYARKGYRTGHHSDTVIDLNSLTINQRSIWLFIIILYYFIACIRRGRWFLLWPKISPVDFWSMLLDVTLDFQTIPGESPYTSCMVHLPATYWPRTDQVPTTYRPGADHILTTYRPGADDIPTRCRPRTDQVPTTYRPGADHILTTYWPRTDQVPTTYRPGADHILTTYRPGADDIPTRCRPHTDHILTRCRRHTDQVPTTYWPRTDQVPTTYRPQTRFRHCDQHSTVALATKISVAVTKLQLDFSQASSLDGKCDWIFVPISSPAYRPDTVPPTYRQHTDHILTTNRPHTDHITTTYRPHTDHIPTTYWPYNDHLPTTYWPLTDDVADPIPTAYRPRTDHIPNTYLLGGGGGGWAGASEGRVISEILE